jgi:hypothetical protein
MLEFIVSFFLGIVNVEVKYFEICIINILRVSMLGKNR